MSVAVVRSDLKGLLIPTSDGYVDDSYVYEYKWSDDDEFMIHNGIEWVYAESIDFDFIDN